jgi:aminopeptidase N
MAMTFKAQVEIDLQVDRPTPTFTLNAVDLKFGNVFLLDKQGRAVATVTKTQVRAKDQTVVVHFNKKVDRGTYRLSMDYEGVIGTQASGLFALSYDTPEGRKKGLYTQFENSDARRLFPSWDEPNYKASFTLEVIVPTSDMAVSNMPIESKASVGNDRIKVRFVKTPRMSTYLLFFGSGDFERATTKLDQTELGVVTRRGSLEQANEALDASRLVLTEYNDYFDAPYPLPKLDNVAAPGRSQFFSAMENWGAILTFESVMLIDPKIANAHDRENVFSIAAHEIAHQWFGNLVTMQWWDDLWLNEGFASWMESRITAKLHPEWNSHLNSVFERDSAMTQDALRTTHPVVQRINTVDQVSQAFDGITYQKGQSVIHMLESYVGADAWREGVRTYMKQYAYGNTRTDDFWAHMDKASGQAVSAMAHDFTRQPGIPLIQVADPQCKDHSLTLGLLQTEFSDDRPNKKPLRWRVPVKVQSVGSQDKAHTVVDGGKGNIRLDSCTLPVVNAGQTGYFRTLYSASHFQQLAKQFGELSTVDQLGLLLDTWALGAAGMQTASNYLDLVHNTPFQAQPQVWGEVADQLSGTHRFFENDRVHQAAFDKFAVSKLSPVFGELGWEDRATDSHSTKLLRGKLISALSVLGDTNVITEARRRYAMQTTDPSAIPAELRRSILNVVARHADAATWDKLHAEASAEKTPLIRDMLYGLLARTEDQSLAHRALNLALTDEVGETNSAAMVARVAALHPEMAFDFALVHMSVLNKKVDASSRSRYFPELASSSAQPALIDKVRAYANRHLAVEARRGADEAMAEISDRIAKRKRVLPSLIEWLAHNNV